MKTFKEFPESGEFDTLRDFPTKELHDEWILKETGVDMNDWTRANVGDLILADKYNGFPLLVIGKTEKDLELFCTRTFKRSYIQDGNFLTFSSYSIKINYDQWKMS